MSLISYGELSLAAAALAMARLLQAAAMLLQLAEDPILLEGGLR